MTTQSLEALELANAVRVPGLRIRREMAAMPWREGRACCADLLEHPPEGIGWMTLHYLLRGVSRTGPFKASGFIAEARLPLSTAGRTIRQLTQRQREAVAGALRASCSDRHRLAG